MIWLNPDRVMLGSTELRHVTHVAIDRAATRLIEEWTDLGPYTGFADAAEQRVTVSIVRRILETEAGGPTPGEQHTLSFRTAPGASASSARAVSATVVVASVEHSVSSAGAATQRIRCVAVSASGATNPIGETIIEGEV